MIKKPSWLDTFVECWVHSYLTTTDFLLLVQDKSTDLEKYFWPLRPQQLSPSKVTVVVTRVDASGEPTFGQVVWNNPPLGPIQRELVRAELTGSYKRLIKLCTRPTLQERMKKAGKIFRGKKSLAPL